MSKTLHEIPERIFIDATYTIGSGKNSGIERVVRSLLREFESLGHSGRIPVPQLTVSYRGKFFEVSQQQVETFRKTASIQANVLSSTPATYQRFARSICSAIRSNKLRKWLLPQPGHLGIFKLWHSWQERLVLKRFAAVAPPVEACSSDLFVLPDAYWINRLRNSVWSAAADARLRGAHVASVIYDLIPLTHPEFVGLRRRDAFRDYLLKAAKNSDLLVAISESVRNQLTAYLAAEVGPFHTDIRSYQLGAELKEANGIPRECVRKLFSGPTTPYLMVATFDPRKNHKYILDAFDRLWKSHPTIKLCLVGRTGSRCDDVLQRIRNHPRLNQQLFLFDDLTDSELQHCYHGARGVVFPSIVEGFGLPIVEALSFGKKTFVSDTAIHREVGREDCCYFDLGCPSELVDKILRWEDLLAVGWTPELPVRQPTTWQQSSEQILEHLLDSYSSPSRVKHATPSASEKTRQGGSVRAA